ncbi:MAG: chloride channel protein [Ruminococcus sp.]|uniref:chloride channel protein n=1 Tax=Ruminococcus sp. TaxID=41978 RepID=UPI0028732F8D|nr:chloride channel protein [Ruminococcus sp.]MBQ3284587.1 chloride channel protein [Ruminococcus sp.]
MDKLKETAKHNASRVKQYIISFFKWTLIALITGAVGGGIGAGFRYAITWVTDIRMQNPWLCFLLPAGGVIIAFLYRVTKLSGHADTNLIINSVRSEDKVPILLAPVIFLSTVITHLFGGSAGREGAALQLGGCIGSFIGRVVRLNEKDMPIALMCGMSGLFSALFGTPLTATVFAMEVISVGVIYYSAFLPCLVAALTAFGVTFLCGLSPAAYALTVVPELNILNILTVAVIGVAAAVMSIVFCVSLEQTHKFAAKFFHNEYLRTAVGGTAIALLTLLIGTRYNGIGGEVIAAAVTEGEALPYDFILKMLFTVVTIGFGYKGGEIIPTFFIGATLGATLSPLLGLPASFGAAIGLVALFCAVVNCPIASIILSIELFGSRGLIFFAVSLCVSYMLSGYYSLYSGQKIMYSKRRARFINKQAK